MDHLVVDKQAAAIVATTPVIYFLAQNLSQNALLANVDNLHFFLLQIIMALIITIWNQKERLKTKVPEAKVEAVPQKQITGDSSASIQDTDEADDDDPGAEMIDRFQSIVASSTDWKVVLSNDDVTVQTSPHSQYCFKVTAHRLPNTPFTLFSILTNVNGRKDWDKMFDRIEVIKPVDEEGVSQEHVFMKSVWPVAPRDCVTQSVARRTGKNTYVTVNETPKELSIPPAKGFVRLTVGCSGFLIEPADSEGKTTKTVQILDGDPGAWVPSSVISMLATKTAPESIKAIADIAKRTPEVKDTSPEPSGVRKASKKAMAKRQGQKGPKVLTEPAPAESKSTPKSKVPEKRPRTVSRRSDHSAILTYLRQLMGVHYSETPWLSGVGLVGSTTAVVGVVYWIMSRSWWGRSR